MNKNVSLILLLSVVSITLSCIKTKKTVSNDLFKFELLKYSNHYFDDSTRVKLNLYFNNLNIAETNKHLSDIDSYSKSKEESENPTGLARLFAKAKENDYVPSRLKRKKTKDKYGYSNYVLDSTFYEGFKIENLAFISESYYNRTESIRLTREDYDENIKLAIDFKYDQKRPIRFSGNTAKFNMEFSNATSKEIKDFEGVLYICDGEMNVLSEVSLNSNVLNRNVSPDPLKPIDNDRWQYQVLDQYYDDANELRIDVSDFRKKQIQDNYKQLELIFITKNIRFEDGTYLSQ